MAAKPKEIQEEPLSQSREFGMLIEHAVSMAAHVLDEVSEEDLENTTVTIGADFLLDMLDCVIEMACRYEDFDQSVEELMTMYEESVRRQTKFGSRSIH